MTTHTSESHNPEERGHFGRYFRWLWIQAFIFAICASPVVMILKEQYPWVSAATIAVGAIVVTASNHFIGKIQSRTVEKTVDVEAFP